MLRLYGAGVKFTERFKYLGTFLNASLKHDSDIQRQVKTLVTFLCSKQTGKLPSLNCSKNALFFAYFMPM